MAVVVDLNPAAEGLSDERIARLKEQVQAPAPTGLMSRELALEFARLGHIANELAQMAYEIDGRIAGLIETHLERPSSDDTDASDAFWEAFCEEARATA